MHLSAWYLRDELTIGKGDWAYNEVFLPTDASKWVNYTSNPLKVTIDQALGQCGFIGWIYMKEKHFRGVQATGTMGWDEFKFNLTSDDRAASRTGKGLQCALIL